MRVYVIIDNIILDHNILQTSKKFLVYPTRMMHMYFVYIIRRTNVRKFFLKMFFVQITDTLFWA